MSPAAVAVLVVGAGGAAANFLLPENECSGGMALFRVNVSVVGAVLLCCCLMNGDGRSFNGIIVLFADANDEESGCCWWGFCDEAEAEDTAE